MDLPEAKAETSMDYRFLYTIYSFLGLLIFFIVISFAKAIYHYYKVRGTLNVAAAEDAISTECNSISSEDCVPDEQFQNNEPESDMLRDQLDKLRRLLNRLNAMGTFSRDTIGDLSEPSAAYLNTSVAASSDLSAFWSSIDFDDFDDSTINEGNFRKTPTEKSVSPSVSGFSLDTSGLHIDNFRRKNMTTYSRDNIINPQTNPSDAIVQILSILDSIMQKNRNNIAQLPSNTLNIKRNFHKSTNIHTSSRSVQSAQSCASQKTEILSDSRMSLDKNTSCRSESNYYEALISSSRHLNSRNVNTDSIRVDDILSKQNLLDQLSQFIDSQYKLSSTVSEEAKISKGKSYVNITSASGSKNSYSTKLSTSSKSLDNKQLSLFRSVAVDIDPVTYLSAKSKETSAPALAYSKNPHLYTHKIAKKAPLTEMSSCTVEIEAMNRSHSASELSDKISPVLPNPLCTKTSPDGKKFTTNCSFQNKSLPEITISESLHDSQITLSKYDKIFENENTNNTNCKCGTLKINKEMTSTSSRSLQFPKASNVETLKSFMSEPQIKQSPVLKIHSPNVSTISSDTFLSPIVETDQSLCEKIDWKSPVEVISNICLSRNLTPHNENTTISRKSCIWSTPPSPEETSHVVDKNSTYKISSMKNLDKCKY